MCGLYFLRGGDGTFKGSGKYGKRMGGWWTALEGGDDRLGGGIWVEILGCGKSGVGGIGGSAFGTMVDFRFAPIPLPGLTA